MRDKGLGLNVTLIVFSLQPPLLIDDLTPINSFSPPPAGAARPLLHPRHTIMTIHETISCTLLSLGSATFDRFLDAVVGATGLDRQAAADAMAEWAALEAQRTVVEDGVWSFRKVGLTFDRKLSTTLAMESLPGEVTRWVKLPTPSEPWTHYYTARNGDRLVPINWLDDTYRWESAASPREAIVSLDEGLATLRARYSN